MLRVAIVLLGGALASGCVTTRAQAPIERPALEVPPAPPRVIEPAPAPETRFPEPVADLPPERTPPPPPKPRPTPPREAQARPDTQKPDTKPETPPAADPAPTPGPAVVQPAPLLRTPATADTAAAEREIRETLNRAQSGLKSVDYQRLRVERKNAYDQAKDFITGAESAIKSANFELAKELAQKADKLVKELQGR